MAENDQSIVSKFDSQPENDVKGNTILIVDDNFFNIDVLKGMIQGMYPSVEVFDSFSGQGALDIIVSKLEEGIHFDTCFIDVNMPGMNGCQLADAVHKLYKEKGFDDNKPILLAVTAQENIQIHQDWREDQFDAIVLKPIYLNQIEQYLI